MMISDPPSPVRPSILVLDGDYPGMDGLVEEILEAHPLPWRGKKILLKPNVLGPYPREKGITTHPSLIRSLVKALKKSTSPLRSAGARISSSRLFISSTTDEIYAS